jgi:hypothetical protein
LTASDARPIVQEALSQVVPAGDEDSGTRVDRDHLPERHHLDHHGRRNPGRISMRRITVVALLVAAAGVVFASPANAIPPPPTVLCANDFGTADLTGWSRSGGRWAPVIAGTWYSINIGLSQTTIAAIVDGVWLFNGYVNLPAGGHYLGGVGFSTSRAAGAFDDLSVIFYGPTTAPRCSTTPSLT